VEAARPVGDDGSATLEEVRRVLHRAADLRMPGRDPDKGRAEWIGELQDYLQETAVMRADLETSRLLMHETLRTLDGQWETMEGYGVGKTLRTGPDHERAKRQQNPGLAAARKEAKFLVDRLSEQIERLGGMSDDQIVSRIYSMFG
jgi:hypothetical protein